MFEDPLAGIILKLLLASNRRNDKERCGFFNRLYVFSFFRIQLDRSIEGADCKGSSQLDCCSLCPFCGML